MLRPRQKAANFSPDAHRFSSWRSPQFFPLWGRDYANFRGPLLIRNVAERASWTRNDVKTPCVRTGQPAIHYLRNILVGEVAVAKEASLAILAHELRSALGLNVDTVNRVAKPRRINWFQIARERGDLGTRDGWQRLL